MYSLAVTWSLTALQQLMSHHDIYLNQGNRRRKKTYLYMLCLYMRLHRM